MRQLEKVVIVNTADVGGGAEQVAMALLNGFETLGTETWMTVGLKRSDHPRVMSVYMSPHVDYRPLGTRRRRAGLAVRRRIERRIGLEDFNHPYTQLIPDMTGPRPDVLFCDNLHGGYFDLRELPRISRAVPTVLRLADSWTFTGHCAVPGGCERWQHGCGECPDLSLPPAIERDATARNWIRKRDIYEGARLFVVSPSSWLLERARRSILAPGIAEARVIPNGIDLDTFRPDGPVAARGELPRLLFVANRGAENRLKDFATLDAAVRRLGRPVELIAVGGEADVQELDGGSVIRHEPRQDPERLAALYRSADLYVHAAPQESFSLTTSEALACGTPVVAASSGGIDEVVDSERTGLLVDPGDDRALAAGLQRLIFDPGLRARMGAAGASAARERFDRERMVREMHDFCEEAMRAGAVATGVAT